MSNITLKQVSVEAFGGIDPDSPITIVFPEEYKGVTVFSGDQGTRKTSVLMALESLLGAVFSDYYINKKSKSVKGVFEFEKDGVKYRTVLTKSAFKFEQYVNIAGKDKWQSPGEDKTLIRKFLPYATDPHVLTSKDGTEQIEWIKKLAGSSVDDSELFAEYKKKYSERTLLNRDIDNAKKALVASGSFIMEAKDVLPTSEFVETKKKVETIDLDEIIKVQQAAVDLLEKDDKILAAAKAKIESTEEQIISKKAQIKDTQDQIDRLLKNIEGYETEVSTLEQTKINGNEFLASCKELPEKIRIAKEELEDTKEVKNSKERVMALNADYEKYKNIFDESIQITSKLDDISQKRLEMAKAFTPEIPGFEVRLGNLDEEKGLYFNGVNIASLSESERYSLCIQIWEFYKVQVVFIENITTLGSNAMSIIEMFIKNGGTVFATQMRRNQDKISVSFNLND